MSKGHTLQDPYLNALRKERVPVSIYLVNGIKLQGQIESFDQFVVLLKTPFHRWCTSMPFLLWSRHAMSDCPPRTPRRRLKTDDGAAILQRT